jgi:hypothetical protein
MSKQIDVASIILAIQNNKFTWEEDWTRDWNTQPKRRYFVGRPIAGSGIEYSVQWMPHTRVLTAWTDREDLFRDRLNKPVNRTVTTLIKGRVQS